MTVQTTLKTAMCLYEFDDTHILHVTPFPVDLTDSIIEENYLLLKDFVNNKKVKMFVDNSNGLPFDKKHRLAFERQSEEFCSAIAFYSNSVVGNAIANIFVAMTRTVIPMKIFGNQTRALNWLREL